MVAAALGVGTAAAVGAPLVLAAAGFSAAGVAAGSAAAAWQATIGNVDNNDNDMIILIGFNFSGNVVGGSIFASLQSAGVLGFATATKVGAHNETNKKTTYD